MILQALKDYYDRMAAEDRIAPFGWEKKEISFILVIDHEGRLVLVKDTRESLKNEKKAKSFFVPQGGKKASGKFSNLLWENTDYAFGIPESDDNEKKHKLFIEKLKQYSHIKAVQSVLNFYSQPEEMEKLKKNSMWQEMKDSNVLISFAISGGECIIFQEPDVVNCINNSLMCKEKKRICRCLITGETDSIAAFGTREDNTSHMPIFGVKGAKPSGGNIVSFNFPSACSFGLEGGWNAPVSEKAAFSYVTALNVLLAEDSRQKVQIGDATTVFWSDRQCPMEESFSLFVTDKFDDPNALTNEVKAIYTSVQNGALTVSENKNIKFFILGLSPSAARLSIRFWYHGTLEDIAKKFLCFFDDLAICHADWEMDHLPLACLLDAILPKKLGKTKPENLNKKLQKISGDIMRSIFENRPFPETLLPIVLIGIKHVNKTKEKHENCSVFYARAKLIKGFLNRKIRYNKNPQNERSLAMSLDTENNNIGYRLGRLFAVLEKIQLEVSPGLNATIRDRFYASASMNPSSVFANLMRLKNHHLAKVKAEGRKIYFERLIGEIVSGFDEFPSYLSLDDQGRFAIGYYHQNRDFFTKKTNTENNEDSANLL